MDNNIKYCIYCDEPTDDVGVLPCPNCLGGGKVEDDKDELITCSVCNGSGHAPGTYPICKRCNYLNDVDEL